MQTPTPQRPPRRPLAGWTLIPPILLAFGLLWARTQEQPTPRFAAQELTPAPRTTLAPEATSAPRSAATPSGKYTHAPLATPIVAPTPLIDDLADLPCCTSFAPGEDGKLHQQTSLGMLQIMPRADESPSARRIRVREEAASRGVAQLLRDARMRPYLPANVKLLSLHLSGEAFTANFNQAFADADVWNRDADANLVLTAVVNTIVASGKAAVPGKSGDEVRLEVEGKPVQALGELDASGPIEADMSLVASS